MAERLLSIQKAQIDFAVIGAGNGGQAMAGHLALQGYVVSLWNRSEEKIRWISRRGGIQLEGHLREFASPDVVTTSMEMAVTGARVVMVTVPASAHAEVARLMAPYLVDEQIVVLNPGRTGGAFEFKHALVRGGCDRDVVVAEASTFIYASRALEPGRCHVYGIKKRVPIAALPSSRTMDVLRAVKRAYPQFVPAENCLYTSFDNIGAVFHPLPTILNAGRIEDTGGAFEHYRQGITPSVGKVLEALDAERLAVARAYGVQARSCLEWMEKTYGVKERSIADAVKANHAYEGIKAPPDLNTRYIWEDVPYSLVPLVALARIARVKTPVMKAAIEIASSLRGVDYWKIGRKGREMGISGMTVEDIQRFVVEGGDNR